MLYRENGQFKTSYRADQQIFPITQDRVGIALLLAFAFIAVPLLASNYFYTAVLIPLVIMSLAALGVNILVGYCGQISLGSGAFMAVGAYGAFNFFVRFPGLPLIPALILGGLCATFFGILFGLPSLRVKGLYLAVATLGITYFLEGLGQTFFGSDIYKIDIGMPKDPVFLLDTVFEGGVLVNKEDVIAAGIAAALVVVLSIFFQKTKTGRALRAVADDHQAAQSIGIPLNHIWVIVWCVAGVVALVAGMIWGSKLGVQFSLTTVALRALPVVILGGLTSVPGAIIGGLIIGVGEKLSEVYLGPYVGGGIEIWFAYVLALTFLLFRPQGLFGEKIIDRV